MTEIGSCMLTMVVLVVLCTVEGASGDQSPLKLCKDITVAAKMKKLKHFRTSPKFRNMLQFNIPEIRERFFRKRNVTESEPNRHYTYPNKYCNGTRYNDAKSSCGKREVLINDEYRFPSIYHEFGCCVRNDLGHCVPVKMPTQVLRLKNPLEKRQRCKYVWYIEFLTVGCSFELDKSNKVYDNNQSPK